MKARKTANRRPSLTKRLADHVGLVTFALNAVVATEPDASLTHEQEAERQKQRAERAPKREAMVPAVRKLIAEGEALMAEAAKRGEGRR